MDLSLATRTELFISAIGRIESEAQIDDLYNALGGIEEIARP